MLTPEFANTREASAYHENKVARALGMTRTANSGATDFSKGDVKDLNWLIECKTTMKPTPTVSVKREVLTKLEEERRTMGKPYCATAITFNSGVTSYYILDENTFKRAKALLDAEESEFLKSKDVKLCGGCNFACRKFDCPQLDEYIGPDFDVHVFCMAYDEIEQKYDRNKLPHTAPSACACQAKGGIWEQE